MVAALKNSSGCAPPASSCAALSSGRAPPASSCAALSSGRAPPASSCAALWCLCWFIIQPQAPLHAQTAETRIGNLTISEARARPTPPGISVGAVYFSITNLGRSADRLLSVSTPVASKVEFHESRSVQGVLEMRAVTAVECPPGATVKATPGGLHVMLLGLAGPLAAGTELTVSLHFRDAGVVTLKVPVV
jgi:copper(I)-binding protein